MKKIHVILIILCIILIDQGLKIYIKTNYQYGEARQVFGEIFKLQFVENPGMAYGMKFGGDWGKLALTLFRLTAVIYGIFYIGKIIRKKFHWGFIICVSLIFSGALGTLIDSCFYGMIFDNGVGDYLYSGSIAKLSTNGYGHFLHGYVVDMFSFSFFQPIFNVADASISVGVFLLIVFQKKFFPDKKENLEGQTQSVSESASK